VSAYVASVTNLKNIKKPDKIQVLIIARKRLTQISKFQTLKRYKPVRRTSSFADETKDDLPYPSQN
jgi:hypothetical protein